MNQHFTVMVTKSPFDSRNAENAIAFCTAALNMGHHIKQVFFYQSGVHNASSLLSPNSDEVQVLEKWKALHSNYSIPLNVCITAGARRGVQSAVDVSDDEFANVLSPFEVVGLSAYFEATQHAINIQL